MSRLVKDYFPDEDHIYSWGSDSLLPEPKSKAVSVVIDHQYDKSVVSIMREDGSVAEDVYLNSERAEAETFGRFPQTIIAVHE